MVQMLQVAAGITGGFGLLAFVAVLFFQHLKNRTDRHKEELAMLPDAERAKAVRARAGEFGISVSEADPEIAAELADRELGRKHERYMLLVRIGIPAVVLCFLTAAAAGVASVAMSKPNGTGSESLRLPMPTGVRADREPRDGHVLLVFNFDPTGIPPNWKPLRQVSPDRDFTGPPLIERELTDWQGGRITTSLGQFRGESGWLRIGAASPDGTQTYWGDPVPFEVTSP